MPSSRPTNHWIDVEVTGAVRGVQIAETVRVCARRPEYLMDIPAVDATALRIIRKRHGMHPCTSGRTLRFGFRDWSDSVEAVAPVTAH